MNTQAEGREILHMENGVQSFSTEIIAIHGNLKHIVKTALGSSATWDVADTYCYKWNKPLNCTCTQSHSQETCVLLCEWD